MMLMFLQVVTKQHIRQSFRVLRRSRVARIAIDSVVYTTYMIVVQRVTK